MKKLTDGQRLAVLGLGASLLWWWKANKDLKAAKLASADNAAYLAQLENLLAITTGPEGY